MMQLGTNRLQGVNHNCKIESVARVCTIRPGNIRIAQPMFGSDPYYNRRKKNHTMEGLSIHRPSASAYVQVASGEDSSATPSGGINPVTLGVAVASCAAFGFGYHLGVVNGPLAAIAADLGFAGNTALQGAVVSSSLAGAAVGSLGGSGLADSLGRRKAFLLDAVPLTIGTALCAIASGLSTILAGRFLVGLGIGLSSALVPLYISEIAPTDKRGALGSVNQLMICIGILAALLVNVVLPATSWRVMFGIALVPAVLLGVGMLFCTESPAWLALSGNRAEAEHAATKLWGPKGLSQLGGADKHPSSQEAVTWSEVLGSKGTTIGMTLFLLQQFSGINAIVYFSSSVFAKAGIASGALASAAVGAMNVLGTVFAAGLMDKAGRKQLMALSFSGMGVCMLAMALGLTVPALSSLAGPVALIGTLGYIIAFALGAGPVPGLLVPEITPAKVRGRAVALAMGAHWVCNFVIGQVFLPAVEAVGVAGVYLFFAIVCAATVAFVSSNAIPETKGRSLEDIERAMSA